MRPGRVADCFGTTCTPGSENQDFFPRDTLSGGGVFPRKLTIPTLGKANSSKKQVISMARYPPLARSRIIEWKSCWIRASTSESGCRTSMMGTLVFLSTLVTEPRMLPQAASCKPQKGVPRKAMPAMWSKTCFRCGSALFLEARRSCRNSVRDTGSDSLKTGFLDCYLTSSTKRPPMLCATNMRGRSSCQLIFL